MCVCVKKLFKQYYDHCGKIRILILVFWWSLSFSNLKSITRNDEHLHLSGEVEVQSTETKHALKWWVEKLTYWRFLELTRQTICKNFLISSQCSRKSYAGSQYFFTLLQFDKWESRNLSKTAFVDELQILLYESVIKLRNEITGDLLYPISKSSNNKADSLQNLIASNFAAL